MLWAFEIMEYVFVTVTHQMLNCLLVLQKDKIDVWKREDEKTRKNDGRKAIREDKRRKEERGGKMIGTYKYIIIFSLKFISHSELFCLRNINLLKRDLYQINFHQHRHSTKTLHIFAYIFFLCHNIFGSLSSARLQNTNLSNTHVDLFCLHTIDNGVKGRRHKQIDGRQKDMNIGWYMSKTVAEEGKKGKDIKLQEYSNMGSTCIECFESCLLLGKTKNSLKNQNVGNKDKDHIKT